MRTIYPSDLLIEKGHEYTDTEAWFDILLMGDEIDTTTSTLMKRWRWTKNHVYVFLRMLEETGRVELRKSVTSTTIIPLREKMSVKSKRQPQNQPLFQPLSKKIDSELHEEANHFSNRFFNHLTAFQIPTIPMDEIIQIKNTGQDLDGKDLDADEKSFVGYCWWVRTNCPYISDPKHLEQLTYQKFLQLKLTYKYTSQEIIDCLMALENDKDHRKKYSKLFNTLVNWLKLRHGDRREQNARS